MGMGQCVGLVEADGRGPSPSHSTPAPGIGIGIGIGIGTAPGAAVGAQVSGPTAETMAHTRQVIGRARHRPCPNRHTMSTRPNRRAVLGSALALATWRAGAQATAGSSWSLAVVPQFPAAKLHRDWTPLVERIARDTGVRLTLRLPSSIPKFEAELLAGEPDFVYLNPYHQVMAHRALGYLPLVRDSQPLTGILVVRRDAALNTLRELDGKDIAFPAPNAFGASLWMRALLAEREKISIRPQYVQTHSNVYRQVVSGRAVAGGGIGITLAQESPAVQGELRVLFETPGAAPHPVSAHPRVPAAVRQAVAQALLRMAADTPGQTLLHDVQLPAPVAADQQRDYQPLERYRLDRYVVAPGPDA